MSDVVCKCQEEIVAGMKKLDPKCVSYELQEVDLISGCTFTNGKLMREGEKRPRKLFAMHSHCPWCGKKYRRGPSKGKTVMIQR
jgi:hypothetical protein